MMSDEKTAGLKLRRVSAITATLVQICLVQPGPGVVSAQSDMNEWAAFTSMREVNAVLTTATDMWAATSGGLLRYNLANERYERFTLLDGLASNRALSIAIDDDDKLWLGTAGDGLSRFDPATEIFDPPFLDFEGLSINVILPLGDRLYVGTNRGISLFLIDKKEVKETYRKLGNLLVNSAVGSLLLHEGVLWAGTEDGIAFAELDQPNLQDPDSWTVAGFRPGEVHQILAVNDTLYAATASGTYAFDSDRGIFVSEYLDEAATAIGIRDGRPLIAVPSGNFLQPADDGSWRRVPGSIISDVRGISIHETGLWLATGTGIRVIPLVNQPLPSAEPAANQFFGMEIDGNGDFWVASAPNDHFSSFGISQLGADGWAVHNRLSGMPSDDLVSLERDARGRLWVGSWGAGVSVRSGGGNLWFDLDEDNSPLRGLGGNGDFVVVSDIERDVEGNMWMVNVQFGIVVVSGFPVAQSHFFEQGELGFRAGLDLNELTIGPGGLKWLTSPTNGFGVLDDGGTPFDGSDDQALFIETLDDSRLSSDRVSELEIGADGTIWVATDNGLNRIQGTYNRAANSLDVDSWSVLVEADGLPSRQINDLEGDSCGNMWVATDEGLTRISSGGNVALPFTKRNSGLINNRVNSLLFDEDNQEMWIATFDGLNRLDIPACDEDNPTGLTIYPNPFVNASGSGSTLTFDGLPLGATVQIFTAAGELVRQLDGVSGQGRHLWNGQNESGFLVASGIYIFLADDGAGNRLRGKFAVLTAP